jgi:hypothetical protein
VRRWIGTLVSSEALADYAGTYDFGGSVSSRDRQDPADGKTGWLGIEAFVAMEQEGLRINKPTPSERSQRRESRPPRRCGPTSPSRRARQARRGSDGGLADPRIRERQAMPLVATSSNEFTGDDEDHTRIAFVRNAAGKVSGLILNPGPWEQMRR